MKTFDKELALKILNQVEINGELLTTEKALEFAEKYYNHISYQKINSEWQKLWDEYPKNDVLKKHKYSLVATPLNICLMLIEDKITDYARTTKARLHLSKNGKYCCRIRGVEIYNQDNFN